MDNNLQKNIEQQLSDYSSDIEVWDQNIGDTFLTFSYRLFLQEHIGNLTVAQLNKLHETDSHVLALASIEYENIVSDDVEFLKLIVDVINGVYVPAKESA